MKVSEEEQWKLVAALFKHGVNIDALVSELPNWGPEKVKYFVKCHRRAAKRKESEQERLGDVACMTNWLAHTRNMQILQGTFDGMSSGRISVFHPKDHGRLLSKVMLYLSEEEEHPPPSSSTDPDYKEIYRYLGQVLAGEEPSQLSQGSAAQVFKMLAKVEKVASKSRYRGKLNHHLHMYSPPHIASRKRSAEGRQELEEEEDKSQECPLFSSGAEGVLTEEEEITKLQKDDVHYELKKQKALKKSEEVQAAMAASLTDIPGLNPFGFSHDLLVKPQHINEEALENS
ncbi:hypothetical protein O3P69_015879 [Scylla paramamosain]|uniref:Uncharacterized protein n=1 Tax=Scylla paramamosain TaxID=85552 RepID=A0AAW0T8N4_SCYPA